MGYKKSWNQNKKGGQEKYTDRKKTGERNKSENKREKRAEHLRDRKFRKIFKISK